MNVLRLRSIILLSLLPPLVAVAVYSSTLRYGFIWDDTIVVKHQLPAFKSVRDIFFPPSHIAQFGLDYYRPIVFCTYLLDRALGGGAPFWFHFSVVFCHALNSLLLFFVAALLFRKLPWGYWGALAAALLFAAHPIRTESVAWMAGRSDVVACLFFLASLLGYLLYRYQSALFPFFLAAFFFLCAILAKETAIVLPFLLLAFEVFFFAGEEKAGLPVWKRLGPFVGVVAVYFLLRRIAVGKFLGGGDLEVSLFRQMENVVLALGFYVEKALVPIHLNVFVAELPADRLHFGFSLLIMATSILLLSRWWWCGERVAPVLLVWFFVTLIPSLVPVIRLLTKTPVAERYLYIPSAGFVMLLTYVLLILVERARLTGYSRIATMGAGLSVTTLLTLYMVGTVQRNRVWADDLSLWQDAVAKAPGHGLPHLHLGTAYEDRGMMTEAEREYRIALTANYDNEGRSIAYNNLGRLAIQQWRDEEGEQYLRKALEIRPTYPTPYFNLAAYALGRAVEVQKKGQKEETVRLVRQARQLLERAVQLNPYYLKAHALLGQVALFMGDKETARRHLREAIHLDPLSAQAKEAKDLLATLQ